MTKKSHILILFFLAFCTFISYPSYAKQYCDPLDVLSDCYDQALTEKLLKEEKPFVTNAYLEDFKKANPAEPKNSSINKVINGRNCKKATSYSSEWLCYATPEELKAAGDSRSMLNTLRATTGHVIDNYEEYLERNQNAKKPATYVPTKEDIAHITGKNKLAVNIAYFAEHDQIFKYLVGEGVASCVNSAKLFTVNKVSLSGMRESAIDFMNTALGIQKYIEGQNAQNQQLANLMAYYERQETQKFNTTQEQKILAIKIPKDLNSSRVFFENVEYLNDIRDCASAMGQS